MVCQFVCSIMGKNISLFLACCRAIASMFAPLSFNILANVSSLGNTRAILLDKTFMLILASRDYITHAKKVVALIFERASADNNAVARKLQVSGV